MIIVGLMKIYWQNKASEKQQMSRISKFSIILLLLLTFHPSFAWNAAGHQLSAAISWKLLTSEQQEYWVDILKHHPRFGKDFQENIPQYVKFNPGKFNEWIFRQAAIWPDLARGFNSSIKQKYHHGQWHYINYPLFLNDKIDTGFLNLDTEPGTDSNYNIIQAFKYNLGILTKPGATKKEKAIALCWVLHLAGDSHQPLHSTALFSPGLFSEGDRGGNLINIRGQGEIENLHWYWDSRLNNTTSFKILSVKAKKIIENSSEVSKVNEFEDILTASNSIAIKYVYSAVILDLLRKMESKNLLQKIYISNIYDQQARAIAEKQILKSGYFITQILSGIKE